MEVKFIVYDPCVSYFNLEIASFIEVLNGISSDHLGQNTLLHEKKLCIYSGPRQVDARKSSLQRKLRAVLEHRNTLEAFFGFLEYLFVFGLMEMGILWGGGGQKGGVL